VKKPQLRGDPLREKILSVTARLFYAQGIRAVGVDRVTAETGITKRSLYKHFPSKEKLALAVLQRIDRQWTDWFIALVEKKAKTPKDRLLALFDAQEQWFKSKEFRGCPFINTAAECSDPRHPLRQYALSFKLHLRDYAKQLAQAANYPHPMDIANQLMILFDGAIVVASMREDAAIARNAKQAARAILKI
jgi:AcrR family transcriptional regulator